MNYPNCVIIDGKEYEINTDFRIAIKCNQIAEDGAIGDFERSLAVIYLLYGEKGLSATQHYEKLLEYAKKFFACGKSQDQSKKNKKPDMDFIKDLDYIEASFMSDYQIDLQNTNMHFWKFMKLMEGLSNSELGSCCILNRIRNIRNADPKKIKNVKDRQELIDLQKQFALEKNNEKQATKEQRERANQLYQKLGLRKE